MVMGQPPCFEADPIMGLSFEGADFDIARFTPVYPGLALRLANQELLQLATLFQCVLQPARLDPPT